MGKPVTSNRERSPPRSRSGVLLPLCRRLERANVDARQCSDNVHDEPRPLPKPIVIVAAHLLRFVCRCLLSVHFGNLFTGEQE